jgi:hypothetical protein
MDENLKNKIKGFIYEYATVDKEIKALKDELKGKTEKKNELTNQLVLLMRDIQVDCFEIGNNAVIHKKRKTRQCLSRKYLKSVLSDCITDQPYVETLLDIIMERRNVTEVDLLVCKNI